MTQEVVAGHEPEIIGLLRIGDRLGAFHCSGSYIKLNGHDEVIGVGS